jgi:hypothetical protein
MTEGYSRLDELLAVLQEQRGRAMSAVSQPRYTQAQKMGAATSGRHSAATGVVLSPLLLGHEQMREMLGRGRHHRKGSDVAATRIKMAESGRPISGNPLRQVG